MPARAAEVRKEVLSLLKYRRKEKELFLNYEKMHREMLISFI